MQVECGGTFKKDAFCLHCRFRSEPSHSKQATSNMKKLLGYCTDVQISYRLASELGFTDYTRDLVKSDAGPYLKDTLSVQY